MALSTLLWHRLGHASFPASVATWDASAMFSYGLSLRRLPQVPPSPVAVFFQWWFFSDNVSSLKLVYFTQPILVDKEPSSSSPPYSFSTSKHTQSCPTPIWSFSSPPMTPWAVSDNNTVRIRQRASCHHLSSPKIHSRVWLWEKQWPPRHLILSSKLIPLLFHIDTVFCTAPEPPPAASWVRALLSLMLIQESYVDKTCLFSLNLEWSHLSFRCLYPTPWSLLFVC